MNNIILIGMPGCGKSTMGILLAKIAGFGFIDTDLLIQKREKRKLYRIIGESGPEYFKKVENEVGCSVDVTDTVIATGGSMVYGAEAMEHLKSIGTVVYLRVSLGELKKRIRNTATRGIVMSEGVTLKDLYEERAVLYEKYADITVDCSRGALAENAEKTAQLLGLV